MDSQGVDIDNNYPEHRVVLLRASWYLDPYLPCRFLTVDIAIISLTGLRWRILYLRPYLPGLLAGILLSQQ